MTAENSKRQKPPQNPEHHRGAPLEEHDLEPRKEQSEKIRGGALPPNDIRGVYITPPET